MFREFYKGLSFENAISEYPGLIRAGEYANYLEKWVDRFEWNQFLIIIFDDLKNDQRDVSSKVFKFIGVDPLGLKNISLAVSNAAIFPRVQNTLHKLHLQWLIDIVKNTPLDHTIRTLYRKDGFGRYPPMRTSTYEELQVHYTLFNRRLANLLNRDLSMWDTPASSKKH